jgi:predicted nucleotidyltransferase
MVGEIEEVLEALNRAQVRYLVVGGVAVVLHGYLRTTADLDLVVQLRSDNVQRALSALSARGYRPRAPIPAEMFADPEARHRWITEKHLTVFSLWSPEHPALEVDLFVEEPFDFDTVYARAVQVRLDRAEIMVVGLEDLLELKRRAGRPQDQQDIAALEALSTEPPDGAEDPRHAGD